MSRLLEVLTAGPLASVQDLGRADAARYGVPRGGVADRFALLVANRLVGNEPNAAALEITAGQTALRFNYVVLVAIAGADLQARLDGVPVSPWEAFVVAAGAELRFGSRRGNWGARAVLAIGGGIDVPLVLGSRSTALAAGFGGFAGRALRAGDVLPLGEHAESSAQVGDCWPDALRPQYCAAPRLRMVAGPQWNVFASTAEQLASTQVQISAISNRQGYRLEGIALEMREPCEVISHGVLPGTIQVPPGGAPILLTADAQPTGGYPVLGVVIEPDLPVAAQLMPGDTLTLECVSLDLARAARREYEGWLRASPERDETNMLLHTAGALG